MNNHNERKFLVDAMLGNIVKKLRLMGFDSKYSSDKTDDELLKTIQNEKRILITKDEELSKKVKKLGLEPIFVTGNDELLHFQKIKEKLGLKFSIKGDSARCTVCNGELNSVEKNLIKDEIPKKVIENENSFWQCTLCKKIYWEGTHITHLQNFVRRLNE